MEKTWIDSYGDSIEVYTVGETERIYIAIEEDNRSEKSCVSLNKEQAIRIAEYLLKISRKV